VLDTVDEAITKTEAVIAKLKQVRTGLLNDLLTLGLDEHGQLRDPIAHPEQFQDSPLGQIPREWEVRTLMECVHSQITYGIVQAGPHVEGGVPYIRTGDMAGNELRIDGLLRTSCDIAAAFRRSEVHTGEIVCAIRATLGKVLEVPPELDGANLTQGTARIAPKPELSGRFILWALRTDAAQRQFMQEAKGTTFPEITLGNLRQVRIAIPKSCEEQERIVQFIDTQEKMLRSEEQQLSKLQSLKAGLMSDLLTGRVRVPESVSAVENQP
jgi:type I restriction enzyme, S subunit